MFVKLLSLLEENAGITADLVQGSSNFNNLQKAVTAIIETDFTWFLRSHRLHQFTYTLTEIFHSKSECFSGITFFSFLSNTRLHHQRRWETYEDAPLLPQYY